MLLAGLLTAFAICGLWAGAVFGANANRFADHLAAAGGGLLFGIALFWLVPEVGQSTGLLAGFGIGVGVAGALWIADESLTHTGHSIRQGVIWPLLVATSIHAFLDGWSVRLLSVEPVTDWAVTAGLSLHKIAEGVALGWLTRRSVASSRRAVVAAASAELFTLCGAWAEPRLNSSGVARFGPGWTAGVLAVIAGGFLFIGFHAVMPAWRRLDVMGVFLGTLLLVSGLALMRGVAV